MDFGPLVIQSRSEMADPDKPLAQPGPWNTVSEGYDVFTRGFLGKYSEAGREELGLEPHHVLLDVACGPGTASLLYAPYIDHIEAIDFAPEMVSIFERHIANEKLDRVKVRVGDGQSLPFDDCAFDRAVSMFGIMFFPDRVQGIREIARCLKPGGRALISSWASVDQSPLMQVMFAAGRAANPDMPAPQKDWESWENPDLLREEMERGGFVDVNVREVICIYPYSSGGEIWDQMVEGGVPLVLARQRMAPEEWEKYSRTCRDYLARELAHKPTLGSTAYLAYGTRPA